MHIIDRRLNPKGKSLVNKQRFIRRARTQIREAIEEGVKKGKITDIDQQGRVRIKGGDRLAEPAFRPDGKKGARSIVLPGNKEFSTGDQLKRPKSGEDGAGSKAGDSGDGEDGFQFTLSRDEFLEFFFDNLELPDFIKRSLKKEKSFEMRRAGYRRFGNPSALDLKRTMRNSLSRRIALKRPGKRSIQTLEDEIARFKALSEKTPDDEQELNALIAELHHALFLMKRIPFLDPMDVRFRNFEKVERPVSQAVMFCLMDVSGSMSETLKDLAKRFFLLLHMFLKRQYQKVDIVFIRHTTQASEVDEETFFYSRETGGTFVSTAMKEMKRILDQRYPLDDWNIYAAQASDGENYESDNANCVRFLNDDILPACQYYAYIEVYDQSDQQIFNINPSGSTLWRTYSAINGFDHKFALKRIGQPSDIYPVFRQLFAKKLDAA